MITLEKKTQDHLNIIKKTIGDTRYILDDAKPASGIKEVLYSWLKSFVISNLILFIYVELSLYLDFFGTKLYYQIFRLSQVILFCIPVILYLFYIYRIDMTVKEKDFLKEFMIFPIFISFFKMLNSIAYYLDVNSMVSLYDTIPFDLFIAFIAIYQLYRYFDDKKYKYIAFLALMFVIMFILIKYIAFKMITLNTVIINMNNLLDIMNTYSLFLMILFGLVILFIKEEIYE